ASQCGLRFSIPLLLTIEGCQQNRDIRLGRKLSPQRLGLWNNGRNSLFSDSLCGKLQRTSLRMAGITFQYLVRRLDHILSQMGLEIVLGQGDQSPRMVRSQSDGLLIQLNSV